MSKSLLLFLFFAALFTSCAPSPQEDATKVCDCWSKAFKLSRMDEAKQIEAFDACEKIYKDVLLKLENNPEDKGKFVEAYDYCRENPSGH